MTVNSLYLVNDDVIRKCVGVSDCMDYDNNQLLEFQDGEFRYLSECTLLERHNPQVYFAQRASIIRWYFRNTPMTRAQLAEKYGISYSTIASLVQKIYKPGEKRGPKSGWRR